MNELIKPGEAALMLGVSRDSIRRYMDSGAISGITTPGGQRRIDRESVTSIITEKVGRNVTIVRAK